MAVNYPRNIPILATIMLVFYFSPVQAQSGKIINLDPAAFKAKIAATPDAQILDLRTPEDYVYSHIPSSVNIEPTQFDFLIDVKDQLGKSDTLFIYCRVGKPEGVGELLLMNGYSVIYNLKGGSIAWEAHEKYLAKQKQRQKEGKEPKEKKRKIPKERRQWYLGTC